MGDLPQRQRYLVEEVYDGYGAYAYSASVAVQARPGGGHVVVVANRRDGVAVRDTAGTWRRLGFTDEKDPVPLSAEAATPLERHSPFQRATFIAAGVAAALAPAFAIMTWRRRRHP
ncbi:hypothetical protein [Thermocatellispora tengchongensis]|uniref:hypothetical protein n=1 Tax=Thermocatellispora tengchongensis TaxID=1073253 RepID=UPI003642EA2A